MIQPLGSNFKVNKRQKRMLGIIKDNIAGDTLFMEVSEFLKSNGFTICSSDLERPWGGFFVLEEKDARKFASLFFPELSFEIIENGNNLSPKILVVAPQKRLSWQYHFRRAEIWKLIDGTAGIIKSDSDEPKPLENLNINETIVLEKGKRHRLVGLNTWGIVAEIWQHTDKDFPSDENDIVRLQDDFGRNSPS